MTTITVNQNIGNSQYDNDLFNIFRKTRYMRHTEIEMFVEQGGPGTFLFL